ncbi:MAG: hypothetical protein KAI51_02380 [Candidatus Aenigmarchaeota archaeon]|nr:hypothetical protein [Candidatus Aenigmarchaeota archaeon]
MTHILVFGDSIAWGAWDSDGGWVDRLKRITNEKNEKWFEDQKYWCEVYNLGVDGNNSDKVIKRLATETKARYYDNEENIIIFSVGLNDSFFVKSKKDNIVSMVRFEKNVQRLIDIAGKISLKTIFIGITPVDESKTNPVLWDSDTSNSNETIIAYENILKKICKKNKVDFVEVNEHFIKAGHEKLLKDGVHPNTEGHKLIFDVVRKFLEEKKII